MQKRLNINDDVCCRENNLKDTQQREEMGALSHLKMQEILQRVGVGSMDLGDFFTLGVQQPQEDRVMTPSRDRQSRNEKNDKYKVSNKCMYNPIGIVSLNSL